MEGFKEAGLNFANTPGGRTPGVDLRWKTPVSGLLVGGSLMVYNANGNLTNGTYHMPMTYWPTYYAQYDIKKLSLSYQTVRLVQRTDLVEDKIASSSVQDTRAWFAMGSYRFTDKLQAGVYYTRYYVAGTDQSSPANYFHDWVGSGRYDINSYLYLKLEEHFIDGNGVGFYTVNNPNGLQPQTKLLVAKAGFSF
jgi:hypothetical protein